MLIRQQRISGSIQLLLWPSLCRLLLLKLSNVHLIFFQGYNRCCLVGHDWGGTIAWLFAIHYPEMVTKLIVLNCPHPSVFTGIISRHARAPILRHRSLYCERKPIFFILIREPLVWLLHYHHNYYH